MAGNTQPASPPPPTSAPSKITTGAVAVLLGLSAFVIVTPFFSERAGAAAGIAVGVAGVVVSAVGKPTWPALHTVFRPRRVGVVVLLVLLGGIGHAQFFGERAPAEPKLSPSACADSRSVAQASVPRGTANAAMLEVLYSRACRLYWAQITPTTQLGNAALEVVVGLYRNRGSRPFGLVEGKLTTQVLWSDPARDDGSCFGATVQVRVGGTETTVSTACV